MSPLGLLILLPLLCPSHAQGSISKRSQLNDDHLYGPPLKIGAFNIQMFGVTKASKEDVMSTLVKILIRYDIAFIQEIRDASGKAFVELVDILKLLDENIDMVLSERLGSTTSKEQYAYIFKKDKVKYKDTVQSTNSNFERPPFAVWFTSHLTEKEDIVIVGCHIKPDTAETEISHLVEEYDNVVKEWNIKDVILAGDFNADCSYVTGSEWSKVKLLTDSRFTWLLGDDDDTTVAQTDCAYDRFVVAGDKIVKNIVKGSVKVYRFDTALNLNQEQTADVSDHYPIELELLGKVNTDARLLSSEHSFSVTNSHTLDVSSQVFPEVDTYTKSPLGPIYTRATTSVIYALKQFKNKSTLPISQAMIDMVEQYLNTEVLNNQPSIQGFYTLKNPKYYIKIIYEEDKMTINVSRPLVS